ncbi:MAG: 4-oxalocrotonate tautomerase family protein [Lentisphaeraceae bacterium]|nr:4-oxalocrotonate tautomerase family protein [Lentisphaeraceae bacterium]
MPFINLKIAGSLSKEQKQTIANQFSKTIEDVTGKSPSATYIVFEELERENWAVGSRLLSDPPQNK